MSSQYVVLVFMAICLQPLFIKDTNGQTDCQDMDLAFVIDASGSICDSDPKFNFTVDSTCDNWNFIIQFVYQIVLSLNVALTRTRVAVVTFSTTAILRWNLVAYTDKNSLLTAINTSLTYVKGGETDTTGGLYVLNTQVFNTPDDRPNVNNTAIIITDGKPTNASTVEAAIQAVHNSGTRTLVVGVTDAVDVETLKKLSSDPQLPNVTYFRATDFRAIDQVRVQLTSQTCSPTLQTLPPAASSQASTSPLSTVSRSFSGCDKLDLCFVVDGSGSICDNDPDFSYQRDSTCNNWKSILTFIQGLVNNFNIGPNDVRVALIIFSSSSQVVWGLNNYTDKASLVNAIGNLSYVKGGTTDTTGGLNLLNNPVFSPGAVRPDALKKAIIITDGKPTEPSTVPAAVQAVHANNIETLCVGITNSIDENTLKTLSSPPQKAGVNYFMATDYSTLNVVSDTLQAETCGGASTTTFSGQISCSNAQDIVIVLDASGSICDSDPGFSFERDRTCNNWKSILTFIHNTVDSFPIGSYATRIALVLFSTTARLVWGLDAYTDKTSLLYAIDNLEYVKGGTTDTTGALNVVKDQVYTSQTFRPNVAKLAIIVTDGKPTDPSTVPDAIDAVHASGIKTISIGVTNLVDNRTLILLASPPKAFGVTIFIANDFQSIDEVRQQLLAQGCPGTSTLSSSTASTPSTASTASTAASLSTATSLTTSLASTEISGTTSSICTAYLDLCFLVDGSGSICDSDPGFNYTVDSTCNNWSLILQFISRIIQNLPIGLTQFRVGMVLFASEANVLWNLTTYTTSSSLLNAVNSIQYNKGGRTDTTGGLNLMRTQIYGNANDRPNVNNAAIIITDGKPTDPSTVQAATDAVHNAGIKTYAVGITNEIDENTLKNLSSPPQQINVTYFVAAGFDTLESVRNILQQAACGSS